MHTQATSGVRLSNKFGVVWFHARRAVHLSSCRAVCLDEMKVKRIMFGFPRELLIRQAVRVGRDSGGGYGSQITDFG